MTVIVLSGMPGAGKEIFVKIAVDKGFEVVRMGDVVRQFAEDAGLGKDDDSVGGFANAERERHGLDIWAKRTVEQLSGPHSLIDGCRSLHELNYFKGQMRVTTVSVNADERIRFARLKMRGREDDPSAFEDFKRREAREIGWGILDAVGRADIRLKNEASISDFEEKCMEVISDIVGRG